MSMKPKQIRTGQFIQFDWKPSGNADAEQRAGVVASFGLYAHARHPDPVWSVHIYDTDRHGYRTFPLSEINITG